MKGIIHIVRRDAPTRKRVAYLSNKSVLIGDWVGRSVDFNAARLVEDHHGRGRMTRHVLLSLERGGDLPDDTLCALAQRFIDTFAPRAAWLGAIDRNTETPHVHLVLCNSDTERGLNFSPAMLRKMQDTAAWSSGLLETGRRGAVLEKLTTAKQIAQMSYDQIKQAIESGRIEAGRRSKQGVITSVIAAGRRVRLSTVQRAAALGRDAAHRLSAHAPAGVDSGLDAQRKRRQDATRRGNRRSARNGPMGAAAPERQPGASPATYGREPSGVLFARAHPLQGPAPLPGDFRVARQTEMGGPIR